MISQRETINQDIGGCLLSSRKWESLEGAHAIPEFNVTASAFLFFHKDDTEIKSLSVINYWCIGKHFLTTLAARSDWRGS